MEPNVVQKSEETTSVKSEEKIDGPNKKEEIEKDVSKVESSETLKKSNEETSDVKDETKVEISVMKNKDEGNETPKKDDSVSESDGKPKKAFDSENEDDDDDDDGIQVTIGDIKNQSFEPQKFKAPYQRQGSQSQLPNQGGSATKPNLKGVDLESVGSINGVPIFDYDLDSIKLEDKPWRKPGADIMDYFNYGFTEETWTKYCEKQRRLRLENNCKVGLILGNGDFSNEISKEDADIYLGQPNRRLTGMSNPVHRAVVSKSQGVIDVIGSSSRDSRRPLKAPQRSDFPGDVGTANSAGITHLPPLPIPNPMPIQQSPGNQMPGSNQSSTAAVLPISMNMPPPPLNIPPPDFALPPPTAINPSMAPPPHNMLGNQPILVAPPNPYGVPPMPGQFETFYRQPMMGGLIQTSTGHQKDRRGIPGGPFRFDNPYSAPPPFQPPPGMPPTHWGGMMQGAPMQQAPSRSPAKTKNNSDISTSEDESRSKENSERHYPDNRHLPPTTGRSSRDRSRVREYDRGRDRNRRDYDSRTRHYHSSRHYGYRDSNRNHRKRDRSPRDSSYDGRHGDRKRRSSSSSASGSDYEESRSKK